MGRLGGRAGADYPKRPVARDEVAARQFKACTMTDLYNVRSQLLGDLHAALDAAVEAAYGWELGISEHEAVEIWRHWVCREGNTSRGRIANCGNVILETATKHSADRATDEAVRLWSLANTQYPIHDGVIMQERLEFMVIESASAFSFNARRAMEALLRNHEFRLHQSRYEWRPMDDGEVMVNFRHALGRIIHSRKMAVGFERLPDELSIVSEGA